MGVRKHGEMRYVNANIKLRAGCLGSFFGLDCKLIMLSIQEFITTIGLSKSNFFFWREGKTRKCANVFKNSFARNFFRKANGNTRFYNFYVRQVLSLSEDVILLISQIAGEAI